MSQSKFSQHSFNLPEISLSDNFFSNFDEITKKYNNLELKLSNTDNNIDLKEKNDISINSLNKNITFHSVNQAEYAELIFDSPKAKKVYNNQRKKNIENNINNKDLFKCYLKSDVYYIKNKNNNKDNCDIIGNNENCIVPDLQNLLKPKSWDDDVVFINEHLFSNKKFKPLQREIINAFLMKNNIYVFMPFDIDNNDKNICYQIPAIISNDSINLVILPSISLINEQIKLMNEIGINVMNLSLNDDIKNINIEKYFYNENIDERTKILYITPEKIQKNKKIYEFLKKLYDDKKIKNIIIDEVNHMSQWDKHFKNDYYELHTIKENFPNTHIMVFSSTPSIQIRDDVIHLLNMKKALFFKYTYNMPNLYLEIRNNKSIDDFAEIIRNNYDNKSGIIYCNTQNECEKIADVLNNNYSINCECHYEGLSNDKIKEIENKWINDEIKIIISNNNFGEGINIYN